jgi:hypothetical protein
LKIARLPDGAGLRFLTREYADPDPFIAAACGTAILASDDAKAARIVISGFTRRGRWTLAAKVAVMDALAACRHEEGLAFVIKQATSGDLETRAVAVASCGLRPTSKKALEAVLPALGNRSIELRRAGLRAVRRFRFKEMIPPLIERLGKEKNEVLRVDVLQLLVDTTGLNLGFSHSNWSRWWKGAAERFEFAQEGAGKTRVVTPDLSYFGIEIASKRIAFLVDASNSMLRGPGGGGKKGRGGGGGKRKIDILKDELTRILKALPDDTAINIIYFHRTFVSWKKELTFLRGSGRSQAIAFVRGLTCAFGTNIYDTLEQALKDKRVDTLYLLSDGRPVGGTYSRPEDILREIGAINRVRGAKINCISFGQETGFLKQLAADNDGEYRATFTGKARNPKAGGKGKGKGKGKRKGKKKRQDPD